MTRQELGITEAGQRYIEAIIKRGDEHFAFEVNKEVEQARDACREEYEKNQRVNP